MSQSRPEKEKRGKRREAPRRLEPSEEELESKTFNVQQKRFYVDVKQNNRGRFIKITEMGSGHKSRIILTMSTAVAFAEKVDEMKKISEEIPENEEEIELKSETLNHGQKRFYLDLKQNTRGRFLRIAQTLLGYNGASFVVRTQVVVPAKGIAELLSTLRELIDKYSEGYLDDPAAPMKQIDGENDKYFTFDRGTNERGSFLRIIEAKKTSGFRGGITVPASLLLQFRDAFNEFIEDFKQDLPEKVDQLKL